MEERLIELLKKFTRQPERQCPGCYGFYPAHCEHCGGTGIIWSERQAEGRELLAEVEREALAVF